MQRLSYAALEGIKVPRPRDRLAQIQAHARGKRVFDLGALDETAYAAKQDNDRWLHSRLCAVAREVVGIDNSSLVPPQGLTTRPNGRIVNADIYALSDSVARYGRPELIVVAALIEHLPDTLTFLRNLKACPELQGVELVFSTPNACSWHNIAIGLFGRESTHPDHLQIYS